MFEYMTAQETAEKWNVSLRWVQRLCKENRIEGTMNINRVWLIPKTAMKPEDARCKKLKKFVTFLIFRSHRYGGMSHDEFVGQYSYI